MQTQGVFNRTLEAIKKAGAVIVPFNASAMVDYHDKYIGDSTFYTTELGGALSRYGQWPCIIPVILCQHLEVSYSFYTEYCLSRF